MPRGPSGPDARRDGKVAEEMHLGANAGPPDVGGGRAQRYRVPPQGPGAASILSEVHLFAHDFFRGAAEGHDSVAEFITHRGRALYLQYDASRAESGKLSCSIILNRAIAQLLSKDWCRRRVFFILDEAATLPADYGLEKLLALGRDRGARVLGVFQNHDQVQAMLSLIHI